MEGGNGLKVQHGYHQVFQDQRISDSGQSRVSTHRSDLSGTGGGLRALTPDGGDHGKS